MRVDVCGHRVGPLGAIVCGRRVAACGAGLAAPAQPYDTRSRPGNDLDAVLLKSGVKFGAFIRICPKTTHSQAKFMQQLIKVSRSRLQSSSGFNL